MTKSYLGLLCLLSLPSSVLFSPARPTQTQAPKIDLNGQWIDGSRQVTITHIGSSVVAKFNEPPMCDPQDGSTPKPRNNDFVGTLTNNTIDGYATVCNWGKSWGSKIGIQSVKMVLAVSADQNTLHGSYDGWKGPEVMTLTRKCEVNEAEMCVSVGRAINSMKGALTPTPSAALYAKLQQDVGVELSQLKANVCGDQQKESEVEALQKDLESLKFVSGNNTQNNLALSRIDSRLKEMAVNWCGRTSKEIPPPPTCPEGTQSKTDADSGMFERFRVPLEKNLTTSFSGWTTAARQNQTKKCLAEMFGNWCPNEGFVTNLRDAHFAWQEGAPATSVCRDACQSLGAWYESSACSKGGVTKQQLVDKCVLTCKTSDFSGY